MSQNNDTFNPFDPTGIFKNLRDASMDAASKTMIELVNTEAYAQATGALLDVWLTAAVPYRKTFERTMAQVLATLNMPSRADVISLAERLTNIELRLDDLEATLEEGPRVGRKAAASPKPKAGPGENQQ
jgi:hypothetical protein